MSYKDDNDYLDIEEIEPVEMCSYCFIPYSFDPLEVIMYCSKCGRQQ